jgi:ribonuclease G
METSAGRRQVFSALEEALRQDRAKTTILQISELGLVEMTRKRTRESLARTLTEPCPYCEGKGAVKSLRTVTYEVFRQVIKEAGAMAGTKVVVVVHPKVADLLYGEERESLEELERRVGRKLVVKTDYNLHQEEYQILGL